MTSAGFARLATAPMWATLIAVVWFKSELSLSKWLGLAIGLAGVIVLAGVESMTLPEGGMLAIAAGLGATFSYGIATNYTKFAPNVESFANAHGSMWAATLVMIPLALATPIPAEVSLMPTGLAVLALGVVCSGVAYLIYFRRFVILSVMPRQNRLYLINGVSNVHQNCSPIKHGKRRHSFSSWPKLRCILT